MYSDNTVEGPGRPLRERERKRKRKRKRKTGTVTQRDHLPKRGGSRDLPYTQLPREKREPVRRRPNPQSLGQNLKLQNCSASKTLMQNRSSSSPNATTTTTTTGSTALRAIDAHKQLFCTARHLREG